MELGGNRSPAATSRQDTRLDYCRVGLILTSLGTKPFSDQRYKRLAPELKLFHSLHFISMVIWLEIHISNKSPILRIA
jgi:hypothetical protein